MLGGIDFKDYGWAVDINHLGGGGGSVDPWVAHQL